MAELQPFLISTEKTGLFNYLQPWISPEDALYTLENAQVYRGVLYKRSGSIQFGNQLADHNPVMGIMRFQNETNNTENLVVNSTRNTYLYDDGSNTFNPITSVADSTFWIGMVISGPSSIPLAGTIPTFWPNLTAGSVVINAYNSATPNVLLDSLTDDSANGWMANGNTTNALFTGGGSVNYITGAVSFITNSTNANTITVILQINATSVNYYTGTIKNFFNWTNWQPTDPQVFTTSKAYLYMTNNVDPVTLFDGINLSRPIYYVDNAYTTYITKAFDVKVFQNRLLLVLPSLNTTTNPINQAIFWSAEYNPFNFINNIEGNGGSNSAATSDVIQSFSFLRDICVVRFRNSTWAFRYTGFQPAPFIWSKLNESKRTNCPYASIEYDERQTSVGSTGLTACDGVNVARYDISIIDFYETEMSEQFYSQSFAQRYDNNSETWMLYVSQDNENPLVGGVAPGSDKALIYNFVENTWATHVFSTPMTCLGLYNVVTGTTWADLPVEWQSQNNTWFSYSNQISAPTLLAGDTTGHVYWMDNQEETTDNGTVYNASILSTRWNPFTKAGEKVQFSYIDLYYATNNICVLNISFYLDNSGTPCGETSITLNANGNDANANSDYAMKRVYINGMGEFLRMEIDSNSTANFQINGMILWAKSAGRLTP